ncbi:MAG: ParB/RepB/Spo0J family partition protein [Pirellulales bacterium]
MTTERRLGRGLEALLGRPDETGESLRIHTEPSVAGEQLEEGLLQVSVYEIDTNAYQPRTEFDEEEINSLSESIKQHGLLQPIVIRRDGERYQLISGERRWRAAIRAGWDTVPAMLRDADDRQVAEMTIVENLQRKDLGPLEKATSFLKYLEQYQATQEELAKRLSVDRSTIANLIRLLELPGPVQQALRNQKISAGHARALLPLGEEDEQLVFCKRIQTEHLSVRATEKLVNETIRQADDDSIHVIDEDGNRRKMPSSGARHLAALEQELRAALGTRVEINQSAKGRGKITIQFASHEEFDRISTYLKGHGGARAHSA